MDIEMRREWVEKREGEEKRVKIHKKSEEGRHEYEKKLYLTTKSQECDWI